MARIRTVKPAFLDDEKLAQCRRDSRLLFVGMWIHSDDYGTIRSSASWIKSKVFPHDEALTTAEVKEWLAELEAKKFIIPFNYKSENFYHIRTFSKHQRVDKPSPPIIPVDTLKDIIQKLKNSGAFGEDSTTDIVSSNEDIGKVKTSKDVSDAPASLFDDEGVYKKIQTKDLKNVCDFIRDKKPGFIQPYLDLWNLFAVKYKMPQVAKLNPTRKRKFNVRVREPGFDFLLIIKKAANSTLLLESGWFTFDWLIKNDTNYMKVIEGNYDKGFTKKEPPPKKEKEPWMSDVSVFYKKTIPYLLDRLDEGIFDERSIDETVWNRLTLDKHIDLHLTDGITDEGEIRRLKVEAVKQFLEQESRKRKNKQ